MNQQSILVINAQIFTVDPTLPWAEAMACSGSIISFVGSNKEAEELRLSTQFDVIIDAKGRTLLPGFNDSHFQY